MEEELSDCFEGSDGNTRCGPRRGTCESDGSQLVQLETDVFDRVDVSGDPEVPEGGVNYAGTRRDTELNEDSSLGYDCRAPGDAATAQGVAPPVITVTRSDFAELPILPLQAHAGPEVGWIPVNMVVVLYADGGEQLLETTILDTPVRVRAVPIEYEWDLGDGNTIVTTEPGAPYPSTEVAGEYRSEGWYDITLTTTFAGQFSVDGEPWQDIEGTVAVASDPVSIFSKSLESRLVNSDVPVDEDADPWIPERTADTEGPQDPEAEHRRV